MMELINLIERLKPPRHVKGDWDTLSTELDIEFPHSYRMVVDYLGPILLDDFVDILAPQTSNKTFDLQRQIEIKAEATRALRDQFGVDVPFTIYPEEGGLVPWAYTENGDVLYWQLREGYHRVVANHPGDPDWELFEMGVPEFLVELLSMRLRPRCFPDSFPMSQPVVARVVD